MARTVSQTLIPRLIDSPEAALFAVLDGASVPNLPQELYQHEPDYLCLYRGALEPDLAETAPYLVRLEPGTPFTEWVLNEGWGNHWGILCSARCQMRDLRAHFRRFLIVYDASGKPLYFRYYDPRVLRTFLPTCTPPELSSLFGPLTGFFVEDIDPTRCLHFRLSFASAEEGNVDLLKDSIAVEGLQDSRTAALAF
jgi:hypothetical protein